MECGLSGKDSEDMEDGMNEVGMREGRVAE